MSSPAADVPPARLLLVEDDPDFRALVTTALATMESVRMDEAADGGTARRRLRDELYDVVITDLSLPDEDGLSLLEWARERQPGASWIVLTGHGSFDAAVRALQLGAFDFLAKPLESIEALRNAVRNALAHQRLLAERRRLALELAAANERLQGHVEQLQEACRLLEDQADTIRADLHRAALIQRALIPQHAPRLPGWSVSALYRPSLHVGGDLYDVVRVGPQRVLLLVADAAGHGLSAAMLAVLFRSRLPLVDPDSRLPLRPMDALLAANRSLSDGPAASGLFLTAALCLVDLRRGDVSIASAGHPPLLVRRSDGRVEQVFHTGPALGLYPEAVFTQHELRLERGDRLLLYTDGLFENVAPDDAAPALRVVGRLAEERGGGLDALLRLAGSTAREPKPREDDLTALLLELGEGASILDNAMPEPAGVPARPAAWEVCEILVGQEEGRSILSLRGRCTWSCSAIFHQVGMEAIEAGRGLRLDLTLCSHLDSTFLGTIHELCESAERANVEFRLEGVMPPLEELFQELEMKRVLDHVVPFTLPLPRRMEPLPSAAGDRQAPGRRMLRAHEVLATLSEHNRREFDPLLDSLRREVNKRSGCST